MSLKRIRVAKGKAGSCTRKNMIWLRRKRRPMVGKERMALMGWPLLSYESNLSESELISMTGDMMSAWTLSAFMISQLTFCPLAPL